MPYLSATALSASRSNRRYFSENTSFANNQQQHYDVNYTSANCANTANASTAATTCYQQQPGFGGNITNKQQTGFGGNITNKQQTSFGGKENVDKSFSYIRSKDTECGWVVCDMKQVHEYDSASNNQNGQSISWK